MKTLFFSTLIFSFFLCGCNSAQPNPDTFTENADSVSSEPKVDPAHEEVLREKLAEAMRNFHKKQDSIDAIQQDSLSQAAEHQQSEREQEIFRTIQGSWYATVHTGYDNKAGEMASRSYYEVTVSDKHVRIRSASGDYVVGYMGHMPSLSLDSYCEVALTDLKESAATSGEYTFEPKSCLKDGSYRLVVKYDGEDVSELYLNQSSSEIQLGREKRF